LGTEGFAGIVAGAIFRFALLRKDRLRGEEIEQGNTCATRRIILNERLSEGGKNEIKRGGFSMRTVLSKGFPPKAVMIILVFLLSTAVSLTKENRQKWEVLNPEGVVKINAMKVNPHPPALKGKTVVLRWNGKHNGNHFLDRVGELLVEKVGDVKVIKSWEVAPETVEPIAGSEERSREFAKAIEKFNPDLVIGAQSD